jgi:hypothetical protein
MSRWIRTTLPALAIALAACVGGGQDSSNELEAQATTCAAPVSATVRDRYFDFSATPQSKTFTAHWDVTASQAGTDGAVAIASGKQTTWSGFAATVRFNGATNKIDARNGAEYAAVTSLSYVAGQKYHVRMVVDPSTKKFSAWATPPGAGEVQIARDYAFRQDVTTVDTGIVHYGYDSTAGSTLTGCFELVRATDPVGTSGTVPLTVKALSAQSNAAVFTGMPFPPGVLTSTSSIVVKSGGTSVPRQVKVLSTYPDGSVRVALIGLRVTLSSGQLATYDVNYGSGTGTSMSPEMTWTRNRGVLAMFSPRWYGDSTVFNQRFVASADQTLLPAFETRMVSAYNATSNPAPTTNPDTRSYYDHVHALYMTLLRNGGPDSTINNIWLEVSQFRENEVLHSGTYRGQYHAGSYTSHTMPISFAIVRRMYILGLLEDYYFTGDARSLEVAKEMGDAYAVDAYQQGKLFTYTERIPGWELMGLTAIYEATLDSKYLDAANAVAKIAMDHQDAMATKYPNQGMVSGQTGAYIQDRNGRWFDEEESTQSGAGSPFMTTLLAEGLIRLHWLTGDLRVRTSVVRSADWLVDACYLSTDKTFRYICRVTDNTDTVTTLNPMFFQMIGFAWQVTGDAKYLNTGKAILSVNDWGNHIKEFNQGQHSSGQGLYLLQKASGTAKLTLK